MCCFCCVCKTCCCGRDLKEGVFIWALLDILFHIVVFPLPLVIAELIFFAPGFDLWIFFLVFADLACIIGEKSGRPAFFTLWLIIFFLNICLLMLLWTALGVSVYLVNN